MEAVRTAEAVPRRAFLKQVATLAVGMGAVLVPVTAGLLTFCDPLIRRQASKLGFTRVATLAGLPADGVPRRFAVIATQTDAWNKFPDVPIGAAYLRRTGPTTVQALNAVCPHAGCFIDYLPAEQGYRCPCHGSSFWLDGRIRDPHSPSPRGLDTLTTDIRNQREIWVRFQNFVAGQKQKIPVA